MHYNLKIILEQKLIATFAFGNPRTNFLKGTESRVQCERLRSWSRVQCERLRPWSRVKCEWLRPWSRVQCERLRPWSRVQCEQLRPWSLSGFTTYYFQPSAVVCASKRAIKTLKSVKLLLHCRRYRIKIFASNLIINAGTIYASFDLGNVQF